MRAQLAVEPRLMRDDGADVAAAQQPAAAKPQPCVCFGWCDRHQIYAFAKGIPRMIHSRDSPWYAYLTAVYGGPPRLPVELSELNFFYHRDAAWVRRHPTVVWPMATCRASAQWT